MQPDYQVGKTYTLSFVNLIVKDDNQYIVATDGERDYTIRPYDFQTEYSSFPRYLSCYVRKIGFTGIPYFEQSKEDVLRDLYNQPGSPHKFIIDEVRTDTTTNHPFYILSDEYGIQHRYYPTDTETIKSNGESIVLIVKGVLRARDGKNNGRLNLEALTPGLKPAFAANKPAYPKKEGKNFGSEDEKKEFKSSIVFPAGQTSPDIDKQLGIICRTIAGFMNANGGTLYIGVSDNGYVCGIESDYSHLNDGDDDYTYKENDDSYLQKITNRLCQALGKTAGTLVNMRIEEEEGKKYCIVDIKKAARPIWFYGNKLFVRMVTTNRKLHGDEITQFVLDRVSKNEFAKQRQSEPIIDDDSASETDFDTSASTKDVKPVTPQVIHTAKKSEKAWRHITFFENGEWSFQKDRIEGEDVVCNAIVPSDAKQKNHILILAYENGHVEATYLKELLYGKNGLLPEGKRRGQGLHLANGKAVAAFCVNKKDMLLLTSSVSDEQYVKALDVDTLGIHDTLGKGNAIIRETGATLVKAVRVPNDDGHRISLKGSGIFIEKNQKYTKGGVKLSTLSPNYRHLIDDLNNESVS